MKLKPIYIYILSFIALVALLVLFTKESNDQGLPTRDVNPNSEMPDDEIHKGMGQGTADGSNVSPEFRQRMANLKSTYEANPSDTASAHEYAMLLAAAHKPNESLEVYRSILEIDPNRVDIRLELATVYYNLQQFENAKMEIVKVIEAEPDAADAKYNLGAVEAALGNNEKAKEIWNDIITTMPNSEAANYAKRSLESLN